MLRNLHLFKIEANCDLSVLICKFLENYSRTSTFRTVIPLFPSHNSGFSHTYMPTILTLFHLLSIQLFFPSYSLIDRMCNHPVLPLYTFQQYSRTILCTYTPCRILWELLLYAVPHIILKYSPKGEGFHPSHVLEINVLAEALNPREILHFLIKFCKICPTYF